MNEVRQRLKNIREVKGLVNPDQTWVAKNRKLLFQQISNSRVQVEKPVVVDTIHAFLYQFRSSAFFQTLKPTLTALSIAIMATVGWIASVSASFNSLPGDRLWVVKRVAQNTEIAVKSIGASEAQKVQLQMNLAKSRVEDIKKTVSQRLGSENTAADKQKTVEDLNVAVRDVQDAVKSVSESITTQAKTTSKDNPQQVVETVKDVTKGTSDMTKTLVSTVVSSTAASGEVAKQVLETVRVVNQASINAAEAVIQQQDQVAKVGETNTVKNIVSERVVDLVKTTDAIKADLKSSLGLPANKMVSSSSDITLTIQTATGTTSVVIPAGDNKTNNLEKSVANNIKNNVSSTIPVNLLQEADKQTATVHDSAAEIKKNIDSGNLQDAINQLKDLNNTAEITQKILMETKQKVEDSR